MRLAEWLLFFSTTAHGLRLNSGISNQRHIRDRALFSDLHRRHRFRSQHSNDSMASSPTWTSSSGDDGYYFGDADNRPNRSRRSTECSKNIDCRNAIGEICEKNKCISACSIKRCYTFNHFQGLQKCRCPEDSDEECYLCCGSSTKLCKPAHFYEIYRYNGELWEHPSCEFCRRKGIAELGQPCADKLTNNVCFDGKCTGALCAAAPEGKYCIQQGSTNRICANGKCIDPCADEGHHMCECSISSIYRCELCCVDPQGKCQSAKEVFRIQKPNGDPYPRYGLTCGRYDWTCNALAQCKSCLHSLSPFMLLLCLLIPLCLRWL